jgi:hypothetical protein
MKLTRTRNGKAKCVKIRNVNIRVRIGITPWLEKLPRNCE